jgi:hypothetical protein
MTVIPTGLPAWARTTSHTHYGGNVGKRNHLLQGVIDPETDVSAEQLARMASDLAAIARVSPFASMIVTCDDTPGIPTVEWISMMTGVTSNYAGNSPPAGFPSVARVSNGVVDITFASSYSDDYGVAQPISVVPGGATIRGATGQFATLEQTTANVVRAMAWTHAGVAQSNATIIVTVFSI